MNLNLITPRKALNKAFLKVKPNRTDIEKFKANLKKVLEQIKDGESEEFHKNLIIEFLKNTYYSPNHFVNTKGRNDLVVHNGKDAKSTVGVLIEAKKPANKSEMLKADNINAKAFQELVLYYLRERITGKNLEIKNIAATNIYEWFIFDAHTFEKLFAQDKKLVKQFEDFEEGRLGGKDTSFFYKEVAEPFIETVKKEISFTYFDLRDYEKPLLNDDKKDDNQLIALYKLLSPEHLLKLPFANDSNSLDKAFYAELLHIIGLTETKDGGKKLIQQKKEGERDGASLLENAISQLDSHDKISRLEKASQFGETNKERLFAVGLELVITWINRILFLKLLEAQLVTYHKGDKDYNFLSLDKIKNFDDLDGLFFRILARKTNEREAEMGKIFSKVPYLNSSLFEPTEIEHQTIFISNLQDDKKLPLLGNSKLKNSAKFKNTKELNAIEYLFEFLNAYDFSSEGSEEIQEDNKTLINASVLGLIFEKINGYKDGSFFTPGFITIVYRNIPPVGAPLVGANVLNVGAHVQNIGIHVQNAGVKIVDSMDFENTDKTNRAPTRGAPTGAHVQNMDVHIKNANEINSAFTGVKIADAMDSDNTDATNRAPTRGAPTGGQNTDVKNENVAGSHCRTSPCLYV